MSDTYKVTFDRQAKLAALDPTDPKDATVALLRNLAKLHKTHIKVTVGAEWHRRNPAPPETDTLHLYYGFRPPGDDGDPAPLTRICGYPLERSATAPYTGPVMGRGWIVGDKTDGTPVGQIIDRTAYILAPVHEMYRGVQGEVFARIMHGILRTLRTEKPWRETACGFGFTPTEDGSLRQLAVVWKGHNAMAFLLRAWDRRIEEAEKALAKLYAERKRLLETQSRHKAEDGSGEIDDLFKEIVRLRDIPQVDEVFVRQQGLHVTTKPLVARHRGKRFAIGRFEMRFSRDHSVHVWSIEAAHPAGQPHPHINATTGFTCFGTVSRTLQQYLGERRLAAAAQLMLEWLQQGYTEGQCERPIEEWPEVA